MVFDFKENEFFNYQLSSERKDLVHLVLGAYRSIRDPIAYVSMPITSGKRLYDVLENNGVKTVDELKETNPQAIKEEVISPNIEMGIKAADNLQSQYSSIAPSAFEGKKFRWSQEEYMSLWLKVIEERAREMHMTDGWEYSNGGVAEFTKAMEMKYKFVTLKESGRFDELEDEKVERMERDMAKIKVFDMDQKEISLSQGCERIVSAVYDLDKRGFDYSPLQNPLHSLKNILGFFNAHDTSRREWNYMKADAADDIGATQMISFGGY